MQLLLQLLDFGGRELSAGLVSCLIMSSLSCTGKTHLGSGISIGNGAQDRNELLVGGQRRLVQRAEALLQLLQRSLASLDTLRQQLQQVGRVLGPGGVIVAGAANVGGQLLQRHLDTLEVLGRVEVDLDEMVEQSLDR